MATWKQKAALAVALAMIGWVLPTAWPGHGVLLGFDEIRDPHWYYSIGYMIEAGWFSQAYVFEDTWEGGRGHTGPYYPWRLGRAIPLIFVTSVVLLTTRLPVGLPLTILWALAGGLLAGWGIATHFAAPFPVRSAVLLLVYAAYGLGVRLVSRRLSAMGKGRRSRIRAILALVFYPAWLVTLGATMLVPPFLGAIAYLSSLGILLHHSWKDSGSARRIDSRGGVAR